MRRSIANVEQVLITKIWKKNSVAFAFIEIIIQKIKEKLFQMKNNVVLKDDIFHE